MQKTLWQIGWLCGLAALNLWGVTRSFAVELATATKSLADELPRTQPIEPRDALRSFTVVPGFRVEQVAAEPLVHSPIAASFDENGRMYVVEMCDYSEQDNEMLGNIRLLEDADGDGRFEKSTLFADKLSWPTAVLAWDGGVFVGAAPDLLYLKDVNGDGRADERRAVFTGFGRSNVQCLLNSFHWGVDNRVHGATGPNGGNIRRGDNPGARKVDLRGRDFSFDPRKLDLRPESGGGQYGIAFDDWGQKFNCDNSNHLEHLTYEDRYVARNPDFAAPSARRNIGGNQIEIFRTSRVEPWRVVRTRMRVRGQASGPIEKGGRDSGYFSGASGVEIYRGNALPDEMRHFAFTADPCSNIIHRSLLTPSGVSFTAKRVDRNCELIASSDNWCRPVQSVNAPDGTLYFIDMYRETIEHPASLPPEIKQHLDLTSGRDRGRVYRIVPERFSQPKPPRLGEASSAELVTLLEHSNGWHRDTAARLLCQRRDTAAVPALQKLVHEAKLPQARMHALYVLASLDQLTPEVLLPALADAEPHVRRHAVRLAEGFSDNPEVLARLCQMVSDAEPIVRYQLAFSLGEFTDESRHRALAHLAREGQDDPAIRLAVMTSLATGAGEVLGYWLDAVEEPPKTTAGGRAFLKDLATLIGLQVRPAEIATFEQHLAPLMRSDAQLVNTLVLAYLGGRSQAQRMKRGVPPISDQLREILHAQLDAAKARALDETQTPKERVAAVASLHSGEYAELAEAFAQLLEGRQPQEVQLATLAVLGKYRDPKVGTLLVEAWSGLGPKLRKAAGDLLLTRADWLETFLQAAEEGEISLAELHPAQLQLLNGRTEPAIVARLGKLKAQVQASPRQEVVAAYQRALSLTGDAVAGKRHFQQICATCHRLEGFGHEIGPNLAAFKARGAEAILLNVLDPNREVNPQYVNYLAQLNDGRTVSGMIASENATTVTLRRAENATDTIQRSEIDALRSTRQSIMPEGLEKQLDQQALADVIAYIMASK